MCGPNPSDAAWQQELDRLRSIYREALACTDARADDELFVRSRRSLGVILTLLGNWQDDAPAGRAAKGDLDA